MSIPNYHLKSIQITTRKVVNIKPSISTHAVTYLMFIIRMRHSVLHYLLRY